MNNLNNAQFNAADDIEAKQRRRFNRKRESGFVGNGYWYANYPYMIGAMGTGGMYQMGSELNQPNQTDEHSQDPGSMAGEPAADTTGMGDGGTSFGAGLAGGGMP